MLVFDYLLEVGALAGNRACTDDFGLPVVVDDHVVGIHVPYFLVDLLELVGCPYDVVQQVPHLSLNEVPVQLFPVLYFAVQHVGEVLISQLS